MITDRVPANLRDFLKRREKELTDQLAERKRLAIPFHAELAEIRKAKSALVTESPLGPPELLTLNELRRYVSSRERELRESIDEIECGLEEMAKELAEVKKVQAAIGLIPTKTFGVGDGVDQPLAEWEFVPEAVRIPYQSLTINELVLKALKEHFPTGATIGQLSDFLREKWGRKIDRPSLSPQLTRLYRRGLIGRVPSTQGWFIIEPSLRIPGMRPYLAEGKIIWAEPGAHGTEQHEPLVTRETEQADAQGPKH